MPDAILYAVGGAVLGSGVAGLSWLVAKRAYSQNGHPSERERKAVKSH